MKKLAVATFVVLVASTLSAQLKTKSRFSGEQACPFPTCVPSVFIEPQAGFETYLAVAITKKNVPVAIVTDPTKATYVLKAAPVEIKSESDGNGDRATVSVQLIESSSTKMLWAYSVDKQRGSGNRQSMAEAVAKHFKEFLEKK